MVLEMFDSGQWMLSLCGIVFITIKLQSENGLVFGMALVDMALPRQLIN